jgi:hypothetical protein
MGQGSGVRSQESGIRGQEVHRIMALGTEQEKWIILK